MQGKSVSVEEVIQSGPSNTEILNNQDLFQTDLEEINRDLGTRPTITGVDSIGTTHGNGITHTDINGAQVEENNVTKTAGSRVTDKAVSKQDDTGGPGLVRTLGTWKRVTDKIRPMDTRDLTSTNSGPKRKGDQVQQEDETEYEKRMKLDDKTRALGQLMAHNFGSTVAAK